ncbi:MAG TPA: hypothetical protein PKI19_01460 [Elusimicrobiales bacterium]|nr:hypothetical protein [Elusimicrobiales bacterium]
MTREDKKIQAFFTRFTAARLAQLRRLATPRQVQDFLDYELGYHDPKLYACFSALTALKRGKAHCLEGALIAAAAFILHGRRPLLVHLRANCRDDDHVIAPFRENGLWGAVSKSHFCGLRYREPIYRSIPELARSYFEFYYNDAGEKTLRKFSMPVETAVFRPEWLYSGRKVNFVSDRLNDEKHYPVLPSLHLRKLRRVDSLLHAAEVLGGAGKPLNMSAAKPYPKKGKAGYRR